MKRFDRAVYAMFLLVLLADVARAHASVPIAGDPAGNLIFTAAQQLRAGSAVGTVLALRRSDGSLAPVARLRNSGYALSAWSHYLSARANPAASSHLVLLSAANLQVGSYSRGFFLPLSQPCAAFSAVFDHTCSPAP
jgi:hypothetical protein